MSIAYIKPLVLHYDQLRNSISESYDEINIKNLSKEDKLFLFKNVLPAVGKREPFVESKFFDIIKSVDKSFDPIEIWEKYTTITISEIIEYVNDEDELFSNKTKENIINKFIDLALENKIYSFRQDW